MSEKKFATAINCMDGRTQLPVMEYMKKKYKVDYVDTITEPGPNGILASNKDHATVESIKRRVVISTGKHGSKYIAVVGHHDCAGNPVDKNTHLMHIRNAIKTVKSWGFNTEVIGLWVDENWKVNEVQT
ncbi:MAG: hypothetical protein A2Y59_05785 [Chloroflexi bacterium RBG_13_52_14]|nr:MAG: hypothetical protein A2Y59_05785 [Chloroflexi bacterium RBG_13_52_14]